MNRDDLRLLLLNDPRRKASMSGHLHDCEGMDYLRHECQGPIELNEVLIPRNVFQKLPEDKQDYFFHPINCSLNCRLFHADLGHSSGFRQWFRYERLPTIFFESEIELWIDQMPLKIKRVK